MKLPLKVALSTAGVLCAIGSLFWMRALASWRPQKIGALPKGYFPLYISSDGRFITAFSQRSTNAPSSSTYESFDLATGRSKPWSPLGSIADANINGSGQSGDFAWAFKKDKDAAYSLELKDMATGQLKHTLKWGPIEYDTSPTIAIAGGSLYVLSRTDFKEYDLTTDQLRRRVFLKPFLNPVVNFSPHLAISPDGKTLYGVFGPNGVVWEAATGKRLKRWKVAGLPHLTNWYLFSPDGRIVVYFVPSSKTPTQCHFVDSATGKLLWSDQAQEQEANRIFPDDSEVVIRRQKSCEVRDLLTGHLKRRLPGPRLNDGLLLRITHDWIYTTNTTGISRWRAR